MSDKNLQLLNSGYLQQLNECYQAYQKETVPVTITGQAMRYLQQYELIDGDHNITKLGRAHIKNLLETPFPSLVETWQNSHGEVIEL